MADDSRELVLLADDGVAAAEVTSDGAPRFLPRTGVAD